MVTCECAAAHERRRVVLTGGPGAGKTAVLELVRQSFCEHVKVLPEAAGVVFGGGFPREDDAECKRAAQRAIFHVQRELENAGDSHNPTIVLCDRGTLDGLAYWPVTGRLLVLGRHHSGGATGALRGSHSSPHSHLERRLQPTESAANGVRGRRGRD